MNNIDVQRKYLSTDDDKSDPSLQIVVTKVTNCLSSHRQCTGRYIDFSFKYTVICHCECHSKKQKALDSVEGPVANAEGNESFQEETQNDCK
jgi:hypothetical protein